MSLYREEPNYTTKPSLPRRLGRFLLILLLLGGVAAAAFLFFFRGYVVDTENGPRLELPFLAREGETIPTFSGESELTLDTEATPLLEPLHAISLSVDSILDGSYESKASAAGCNAVVFDMRSDDGSLGYLSSLPLAIEAGASAATPGLNDAIRSMNRTSGLYTIAQVSCFPDDKLTRLDEHMALRRVSGALWLDSNQTPWLSPDREEVWFYLEDICRELSALGFDEILLTNCAYPLDEAVGQLEGSESYQSKTFTGTMEQFYQTMRRVMEQESVRLSILFTGKEGRGDDLLSNGQTLESVALFADRIWMETDPEETAAVFADYGLSSSGSNIVCILPKSGDKSLSWAIY